MNPNSLSDAPENSENAPGIARRTVMHAAWAVPIIVAVAAAPSAAASHGGSHAPFTVTGGTFIIQKGGGAIKAATLTVPFTLATLGSDPTLTIVSIQFTFTIPPTVNATYNLTGSGAGWTSTASGKVVTATWVGVLSQPGTTTLKVNMTTGNSNADAIVGTYFATDNHGDQTDPVSVSISST